MSEPQDSNILWNQLESSDPVSQIGVNGNDVGTVSYEAGLYGNAARIDANGESVSFINNGVNLNEVVFSGWLKLDYNIVNGVASDGVLHDILTSNLGAANNKSRLIITNNAGLGILVARDGNNNCKDLITDIAAGTWFHFMYIYSRSANFDGLKTLAIYINGIQTASRSDVLSDLSVGQVDSFLGVAGGLNQPLDGLFDNVKINQNPTAESVAAVIANMNNEGFPGGGKLIGNKMINPLANGELMIH